jgi:hypothetical protein
MKKQLLFSLIIALLILSSPAKAQSREAYYELFEVSWNVGEEKVLDGHAVVKQEGNNDWRGFTKLMFVSYEDLKAEIIARAGREMWLPTKKEMRLKALDNRGKGGQLLVYIGRISIDSANLEWFTMIVKDSQGKEVARREFEEEIPETPGYGGHLWTNTGYHYLHKKLNFPLTVYVIDELGDSENARAVFQVKN